MVGQFMDALDVALIFSQKASAALAQGQQP